MSGLLLSAFLGLSGAPPAMAARCLTCEEPPPPPPPPPPGPPAACRYSANWETSTIAPDSGVVFGPKLIQRAAPRDADGRYGTTIPELSQYGLPLEEMHQIRYAVLKDQAVANTKSIVIALAGQNGLSGSSESGGGAGNLTGQPAGWASNCTNSNCGYKSFHSSSFVARLLGNNVLLDQNTTFVASFADHRYNWWTGHKLPIARGLAAWIRSKGTPPTLKQIVITGHSRGGCLALHIVKLLRGMPDLDGVKILAVPVDATCESGEMGTDQWDSIQNPVNGEWAWKSSFLPANSQNLCIHNIINGADDWAYPAWIHNVHLTHWKNTWSVIPHVQMGTCFGKVATAADQYGVVRGACSPDGWLDAKAEVLDRALRFVEFNRVP